MQWEVPLFSMEKYIFYHQFRKMDNLAWSFNLFILFYSILFDREGHWGILSSRDPAIHAHGDRAQFRFTESPCNNCALLLPWICSCQHGTTHKTHSRAQLRTCRQITFLGNQNRNDGITMLCCLRKRDHSIREVSLDFMKLICCMV